MTHQTHILLMSAAVLLALALVASKATDTNVLATSGKCEHVEAKEQCFADRIEEAYAARGLTSAFDLIAALFSRDEEFAANCHGNAHALGALAYSDFKRGIPLDFSAKASYCGYGFYHGFMEALLQDGGNAREGRELCEHLGTRFYAQSVDVSGACYHGIGHGSVDGSDPRVWGDPEAMIAESLALCEEVTAGLSPSVEEKGPLYRCVTGAYNSLEILSHAPKYGLATLEKDPFAFCATPVPALN